MTYHKGQPFSTPDADHDPDADLNCAATFHSGWWFGPQRSVASKHVMPVCHTANLNGVYREAGTPFPYGKGIVWYDWNDSLRYSLNATEMKIRPISFH